MEAASMSSILVSLLCVVTIAGLVGLVNWIWLRPKKLERWLRQQGIAGTSYRLLFGDLRESASLRAQAMSKPMSSFTNDYSAHLDPLVHQLITKFGKVFFMWYGPKPMIVISDPELIKEALTRTQEFQKPKINPILDKLFTGLVFYEGDQWTQHRRMLNPAFNLEKLKLMMPAFYVSCGEMINKWEQLVAEEGHAEVDVWPHVNSLSAAVISRAAFGSDEDGLKISQLFKELLFHALSILQSVYIPGLRYIPTARTRRFSKSCEQVEMLLKEIIEKRKKAMEGGEAAKDDLLGVLLDSNMKEIQQAAASGGNTRQHVGISDEEVREECLAFYLAGQDTTASLLLWTLILLGKHQDWQARAREEVLRTFGNSAPNFEGLHHLKTVTMILHEVLRMYPPVQNLLRKISEDTKLGELSVRAGSLLSLQLAHVHRDKESWGEDAEEFRPDRFSEGISNATKGKYAFFPFAWGPRICIGEKFAMAEAKIGLSMILQRFSWELSPSYAHSPTNVFSLWPQHGAQIILHRLK